MSTVSYRHGRRLCRPRRKSVLWRLALAPVGPGPGDRHRIEVEIGAQKRPGVSRAGGIADQDRANWGWRQAAGVPDRGGGEILQRAGLPAIPVGHRDPAPDGGRVGQHSAEFWPALAFLCRPPRWLAWRSGGRFGQTGIQTQPGDDANLTADSGDQRPRGETAVGDDHHTTIRQPTFALQHGLAGPVGQGLMATPNQPAVGPRLAAGSWLTPRPARIRTAGPAAAGPVRDVAIAFTAGVRAGRSATATRLAPPRPPSPRSRATTDR